MSSSSSNSLYDIECRIIIRISELLALSSNDIKDEMERLIKPKTPTMTPFINYQHPTFKSENSKFRVSDQL